MPLSKEHKKQTRLKIVETARVLFNRHGFSAVSIDMIMNEANLTRGGFYNHFSNKDELLGESIRSFLSGRGAQWRDDAGIDLKNLKLETAQQMIDSYLSNEHLEDTDGQCPMIALPSDVGRAGRQAQEAYQELLAAMVWLFENSLEKDGADSRQRALVLTAQCVGAMVLARALPDSGLVDELREASHTLTKQLVKSA